MHLPELKAYEILEERKLTDINSIGYIIRHKKSGARITVISNDDENKVFYIGFRTPTSDSTGVPHIIEHTVLCGSEKYPVKDPFVELVKGSLNTFLNAMTYLFAFGRKQRYLYGNVERKTARSWNGTGGYNSNL